ncbi:MAG: DUF2267 domain-containing protein [Phycisphaerae bacterium]
MGQLRPLQASTQKAHEWLSEFMEHTGRQDEGKAWQMVRAVLHVLRDRMPVDKSAHISAQLPLVIRGLYFDGWKPSYQPSRIRSRDEFVQAVADELSGHPEIDPNQAIEGTLFLLSRHLSNGEVEKIKQSLQPELASLWPEA